MKCSLSLSDSPTNSLAGVLGGLSGAEFFWEIFSLVDI